MSSTSQRLGLISQMPGEERRRHRRRITPVEVRKILAGADVWRFHYGIAHSIAHGEVWAPWLANNLSFLPSPDGEVMCVWPHEALGVSASRHYRNPVSINPIPLDIWIDRFLDLELRRDNLKVVICPSNRSGDTRSVDDVLQEIAICLKDQKGYWQKHFSEDKFVLINRVPSTGTLPD